MSFRFCRKRRAAGNFLRSKAAYRNRCSVQCRKTDAGKIIQLGGEVRFESRVETFRTENGALNGVILSDGSVIDTETAVLAIGHSARDTFFKLYESGLHMEAKAFAVGLRVEHPQELINQSQYGTLHPDSLGAAPYKVTARTSGGRGVYSFCMCPGGYVVNASSEPGRIAVNGMSYSGRNGANANSAIIVSVTPADYGSDEPLAGIGFQRRLEEKAFSAGCGKIPVERYGDFSDTATTGHIPTEFVPAIKGQWTFADVKACCRTACLKRLSKEWSSSDIGFPVLTMQMQSFPASKAGHPPRCGLSAMKRCRQISGGLSLRRGCRLCRRHYFCGDGRRAGC